MYQRLDFRTVVILTIPSVLWAGNAIVTRYAMSLISPVTLSLLRWVLAFLILLPVAGWVLRKDSPLWSHWKRYMLLGLLGVATYSALLNLALQTTTPMNVALVSTTGPACSLLLGACFFGQRVTRLQLLGVAVSMTGVFVVITEGQLQELARLRPAAGDVFVLLCVLVWALYGWLLVHTKEPAAVRGDWAALQLAQMFLGMGWAVAFAGGELATTELRFVWGWPLVLVLAYVAVAPTIIAYRFWAVGVQLVGPPVVALFGNLYPLYTAILSAVFLGEQPRAYHAAAFVLIVGGILLGSSTASRRQELIAK